MLANKSGLMKDIMSYLTDHPEAQDTVDGIVQWWLLERSIVKHSHRVREALTDLVDKGYLITYPGKDSQISYGINENKYEEILSLIKKEV